MIYMAWDIEFLHIVGHPYDIQNSAQNITTLPCQEDRHGFPYEKNGYYSFGFTELKGTRDVS